MARYIQSFQSLTMVPVADTTNMTSAGFAFILQGGTSTMQLKVNEVYMGGESTASTPSTMVFGRDSTIAATLSGNFNALADGTATAPGTVAVFGSTATTKPQRSATLGHLLQPSFNTYGGLVRWQARYGEELTTVGNTASLGEFSLSSVTGAAIISGHCIYELV